MKVPKLLIVDDHDIVREGLKAILMSQKGWGICDEASNGREAIEKAVKHRPDVVVMDFGMPELNGVEAARRIRRELPSTEILILTMHDSEQLAREALDAGARGFLLKTDSKRYLVAAVEALAEHKPFLAPGVSAMLLNAYLRPGDSKEVGVLSKDRLTPREMEVLQMIAEGKSSKEVADRLLISVKTADAHRANLMNKLNLHSISDLVHYAIREKIVQA